MADYVPPTQILPIFDSTVFTSAQNEYLTYNEATGLFLTFPTAQGAETLQAITVQGVADFSGDVNFNNISTPPHCIALPSNANDLCNKQYVDSQAPLTSYQLFFNYSETFTTPAPASVIYKKLNSLEILTPTPIAFTISTIGSQLIAGFFNSLAGLNISTSIPAGLWTILCYSNVNLIADQSHIGIFFTIIGYDAVGVETILYTSVSSPLITVVSPLIGTSSVSLTVPLTSLVGYTGIGIKLYISSNVNAIRTGTIFFQNESSYSSILTSFRTLQAPDLLNLNNVWTGTNSFNNATNGSLSTIADALIHGVKVGTGGNSLSTLLGANAGNVGIAAGQNNTMIGNTSGSSLTTGANNTMIGSGAGSSLTMASNNVLLGSASGSSITSGNNNTCIGWNANCLTAVSNGTAIGVNSSCTTSNTIQLGASGDAINLGLGSSIVTCPSSLSVTGAITSSTGTTQINNNLNVLGLTNFQNNILMTSATPVIYANNATANLTLQGTPALATYGVVMSVNGGVGGSCLDIIPTGATTAIITARKPVSMTSTLSVSSNISTEGQIISTNAISTNRIINTVFHQFQDNTNLAVTTGQIYGSAGGILYDSNGNGGSSYHQFTVDTTVGAQVISLILASDAIAMSTLGLPALTIDATQIATFNNSPIAPTPIITDNSNKVATTAFIKQIAAPANFAGLSNSFFNSFLYSTTNPSLDYMIAGTLGGLAPVTAAAIIIPSLTTYIIMGIRLQAGINFNRYAWNQQASTPNLRCALYTSKFVYVPNSISTNSVVPVNAGGKVEVITAATVTIPATDTYYIYMDSSNPGTTANVMYGATTANVNVCNYLDVAVNTFTALATTVPFKTATGARVSGSSPTTNTDLKIGTLANMTYQSYVFGIFIQYTV